MDFEKFYITWYSRAVCFAREYVLSESDAENIVQDVFLHLYERRDMLDAYINLTAVLFTSIKNKCLDCLRKRVSEQEAMLEMQSEFDMALRMKYDSLEMLHFFAFSFGGFYFLFRLLHRTGKNGSTNYKILRGITRIKKKNSV